MNHKNIAISAVTPMCCNFMSPQDLREVDDPYRHCPLTTSLTGVEDSLRL